uniref:Uncharacterized protein n=1 Tax=Romanomermis culicivorax TaxID=13658 RepID=A0A915KNR1_ROMCU
MIYERSLKTNQEISEMIAKDDMLFLFGETVENDRSQKIAIADASATPTVVSADVRCLNSKTLI